MTPRAQDLLAPPATTDTQVLLVATPAAALTFRDLLHDPTWTEAVNIRWSDPSDRGDNTEDIAEETLSYLDQSDPTVTEAGDVIRTILKRPKKSVLAALGVAEIRMADVAAGMLGRLGWAFIRGRRLYLVILHSAFEDNIPGEHLDDGRNAYTELQLLLIRSRHRGTAHYAFSTRRARRQFNRSLITRAMTAYDWRLVIGGKETAFDDPLWEALEGGIDEKKTREFHEASGRGELDDLCANLYPRNEAGLGLAHRFKRVTVTEGALRYEKVLEKDVEPRPEAAKVLQKIVPMAAAGVPWDAVGIRAGRMGVLAAAGTDVKHGTGRTLDQLMNPGTSIKGYLADRLDLLMTGKRKVRWHAKIQGGAEYGRHGRPKTYTLDALKKMTPAQRTKAEKGYFDVELDWGVIMLPGPDGELCPWGVPYVTWEKLRERLEEEASVERPAGAAYHHKDKKPLLGPHEWVEGEVRYAIVSNRTDTYELHCRHVDVTGGWKKRPGRTLAVWRSGDHHAAVGHGLANILGDLRDQVAALQVSRSRKDREDRPTLKEKLLADAQGKRAEAHQLTMQADTVPELARSLMARGMKDEALAQYDAQPQLRQRAETLFDEAAELERQADAVTEHDAGDGRVDYGKPSAVAAGLIAYPDKAPCELYDAAKTILHRHRARVVELGLAVEITASVVLRLTDGTIGTYPLVITVPNRKRTGHDLDSTVFERVARLWFTAPTAITFAELGERLGWTADEVRRKVAVFLGARVGVPKNMSLVERIPSSSLRTALLDCPLSEVRHAVWAALMPREARVAKYLTDAYRNHIVATYVLAAGFVWTDYWAADTHVFRRRLIALCLEQPQLLGGLRFDDAARRLGVSEKDLHDFSRHFSVGSGNRAPAYPPTVERVIPFDRRTPALPADLKRIRPIRCPHPNCEGKKQGRSGGWCTVILRVPELARWAVLCPDCRRVPDRDMRHVRFPESYLKAWEGPRGFGTTNSGRGGARQTLDGGAPNRTV